MRVLGAILVSLSMFLVGCGGGDDAGTGGGEETGAATSSGTEQTASAKCAGCGEDLVDGECAA